MFVLLIDEFNYENGKFKDHKSTHKQYESFYEAEYEQFRYFDDLYCCHDEIFEKDFAMLRIYNSEKDRRIKKKIYFQISEI